MEFLCDFNLDTILVVKATKVVCKRENQILLQKSLVKVITGIRRCGKSYLLNTIFINIVLEIGVAEDHIIRVAFDSADDLHLIRESLIEFEKKSRKADPEKFMAYIRSMMADSGAYCLLLDEVQMLDCFERVLNGYLRKDNMDVYVTGSRSKSILFAMPVQRDIIFSRHILCLMPKK